MAHCAHCKKPIGCGCQKTSASNKETIHKTCKPAYEAAIEAGIVRK